MADNDHANGQADKFRAIARELECDEDEKTFEETVRKVATAPKPLAQSKR
jgi:hypothetical protein